MTVVIGVSTSHILMAQVDSNSTKMPKLTLQEVITAIGNNPMIQSFDEKIKSYSSYSQAAKSWEAPKLTGGLWMTPYNLSQNKDMGALMLGVEQMIPNPSKQKAELNYMKGMSTVEESMKSFEQQNLIKQAKKIYFEWIILEKKFTVLKESEDLMSTMIKSAEITYTYNQGQLSRIYKARSELYNLQNMQIMTISEIQQKIIALNTLMNVNKDAVYIIDTTYEIKNYEVMVIDTTILGQIRSDIRSIEESIKLFDLKKNLELSKRKPEFGVQYGHMNGFGMMPNQYNLMGMVTIPIVPWANKGYKANLEGIKYETSSLNKKREAILNETVGELKKIRSEISGKKQQIVMYEKNIIPALQKNYSTSLISFEHMKEDLFMTVDALTALKMAKIEHLNIIGELLKMQVEYERQIEK